MAHPGSLVWALELWGYAALGLATWLLAPFFVGAGMERMARVSFTVNGPLSLLGALCSVLRPAGRGRAQGSSPLLSGMRSR